MPWHIKMMENGRHCVVKDSDESVVKCHPTHEEAVAHMAALYTVEEKEEYAEKMMDGVSYPASAFLVVEDAEHPSTWHLRVKDADGQVDARLLGAAWAALHGGYRGNRYEGPDKEAALRKLKALYASANRELPQTMGETWRLFIEHQFIEPEQWIPYLPVPGELKHERYGKVSFTPEKAQRLVDNFKHGVYQSRLPIDAEHQTKLSGAVGWITDMRVNENGSVDALAEWTDRGAKLLANRRFGYISPEFFPQWTDPFSEEVHNDVAIGAAITTRPFIKESHLRSLIANEQGLQGFMEMDIVQETGVKSMAEVKEVEVKEVEYVDPVAFAELQERFTAAEATRAEAEAKSIKLTEALDASNARIARMEETAQTRRFTDLVISDNRWYGEVDTHLKILHSFAEAFGEESEEFKAYVEQQKALAEQLATSELFAEYGHNRQGQKRTAVDELDAKARTYQAEHTGLTYAQAYSEILMQNPGLYDRHVKGD